MERLILEDILTFAAGVTAIGCLTAIILTFVKRRSGQVVSPQIAIRLDEISDRLSRLEPAIDAMAVEVERISEAQRFTARVLVERNGASVLPDASRPGTRTPH